MELAMQPQTDCDISVMRRREVRKCEGWRKKMKVWE